MKKNLLSALFLVLLLITQNLLPVALAGVNQWTSIGPDGGNIAALAIDPNNSSTLYVATNSLAHI